MLYFQEDIAATLLSHDFPCAESFFVEINISKKKWLITVFTTRTRITLKIIYI